jgi:hypothetical protein
MQSFAQSADVRGPETSKGTLALTLVIPKGLAQASRFVIYAYVLPSSGPKATAPPSSLAATLYVSPTEPGCPTVGAIRTCST